MKKLFLIIAVVGLTALAAIQGADPKSEVSAAAKQKVVPKGKTYVQLNAKGKEIARFKSGQTMAATQDCVLVKCPSTFGKDVVCWECHWRAATGATSARPQ